MAYERLAKKFKPGDLIYGNGDEVAKAETAVKNVKAYSRGFGDNRTCILIQNTITDSTVDVQGMTNTVPLPEFIETSKVAGRLATNNARLTVSKKDIKRAKGYQDYIAQHPRWTPKLAGGTVDQPFAGTVTDKRRKIWKRTSKAGLEFQTVVRQRKIHFIVGNMDMRHVANKTGGILGGDSVTSTELRWLFRNWNSNRVRSNVIFWGPNGEIQAPWVADPDTWRDYDKHVQEKRTARDMATMLAGSEVVVLNMNPDF